jgi:hypothetical protein
VTSPQTANQIETWPIERLVEYPRNPRKNDSALDHMCGSIREFGFKIPSLARSDGEVVDGHLRLKAARKLGITEESTACWRWTTRRKPTLLRRSKKRAPYRIGRCKTDHVSNATGASTSIAIAAHRRGTEVDRRNNTLDAAR